MRNTLLVALVSLVSGSVACSGAGPSSPPQDGPTIAPGTSSGGSQASSGSQADAGAGATATTGSQADGGSAATVGSPAGDSLVVLATVPVGVQCVVATVTGADSETVTAAVAAGASTASLNFGALAPGDITVVANAFNSACPGSGSPSWNAEAVQVTIVEGVATQIPLTLRPVTQGTTGTGTFSLPAIAIATGPRTSYAVLSDGTVRAWGANEAGEFGSTTLSGSKTPVIVPGVTNATQIAAGTNYACVIRTDSSVMCWGYNAWSFVTAAITPVNTILPPSIFPGLQATQVSALGADVAFVGSAPGQSLGTVSGPPLCFSGPCYPAVNWNPAFTGPLSGPSVAIGPSFASGYAELCWVSEQGVAQCDWSGTPVAYASPASRVYAGSETLSSASGNFGCAILENGTAQCWGSNTYGELGLGTTATTSASAVVSNLHQVTSIAMSRGNVSEAHTCAVAGGVALCAGSNTNGQLGTQTSTPSATFTPVANLPYPVTAVAAGQTHSCALDIQGTVHCWGTNDDGQLGDGTITTRFSPVTVQPW